MAVATRGTASNYLQRAPSPISTGRANNPAMAPSVGHNEIVSRRMVPVCLSAITRE